MSESEERITSIIANNLVRLLKDKNRTQLELAEYLGVTQATISNWCNGIKMPRMDKIDLICEFFNIKRSDLMDNSPDVKVVEKEHVRLSLREDRIISRFRFLDSDAKDFVENILIREFQKATAGDTIDLRLTYRYKQEHPEEFED
jgi:transcriptional regulator with XRE-family HTH domain